MRGREVDQVPVVYIPGIPEIGSINRPLYFLITFGILFYEYNQGKKTFFMDWRLQEICNLF